MKFLSDILARAGLVVEGTVTLNSVANATTDTDRFLVLDSGVVRFRTGAQILSDTGGALDSEVVHIAGTETVTGSKTFSAGISLGTVVGATGVIRNLSTDGSLVMGGSAFSNASLPARTIIISTVGTYSALTGAANLFVGRNAGASVTSGNNNVFIGKGAGSGITTGVANVLMSSSDASNLPSALSNSIHLVAGGGYRLNDASSIPTAAHVFIGGGFGSSTALRDFYFGQLPFTPDAGLVQTHITFYAPSGSGTDIPGSNFTIAGGRGTGAGTPGSVIISTSAQGASGSAVQTLVERARFNASGLTLAVITAATTDTDAFLVSDGGVVKFRTGTQLLSDIGAQAALTNPVTGTGATNYVTKWTSSSAVGNSQIFDNGTNVGINTASPSAKLDVVGGNGDGIQYRTSTRAIGIGQVSSEPSIFWGSGTPLTFLSGSELMRITSGGNVGIGTTSPAYRLSVQGSIGIEQSEEYLYFNSTYIVGNNSRGKIRAVGAGGGSGYGGDLRFSTRNPSNIWNEDAMVINSSGNVGIGTTSPSTLLHLVQSSGPTIRLVRTSNRFDILADNDFMELNARDASTYMIFKTADTERMRITSGGAVGIGTTNPTALLTLDSASEVRFRMNTGGTQQIIINHDQTSGIIRTESSTPLVLGTAGTERMRITSGGNVGINTSSPEQLFTVAGGSISVSGNTGLPRQILELTTASTVSIVRASYQGMGSFGDLALWTGGTERMRITSGGNVAIGTTSDNGVRLTVNGSTWLNQSSDYGGPASKVQISAGSSSDNVIIRTNDLYVYNYGSSFSNLIRFGNGGETWSIGAEPGTTPDFRIREINGASTRFIVKAGGNVGIGTTSPQARLDVLSTLNVQASSNSDVPYINFSNNGRSFDWGRVGGLLQGDGDGALYFSTKLGGGVTEKMRITSGGQLRLSTYTSSSSWTGTAVATLAVDSSGNVITVAGSGGSQWVTSGSDIYYATGNVGIGSTASPTTRLDVRLATTDSVAGTVLSSYPIASFIANGSGGGTRGLQIGAPTGGIASPVFLKVFGTSSRFAILNQSNVENFTVLEGGNVGIGTASPGYKLDVYTAGATSAVRINADANQNSQLRLEEASSVKFAITYVPADDSTRFFHNTTDLVTFDANGRVGIGTTSPAQRLDVRGYIVSDSQSNGSESAFYLGNSSHGLSRANLQNDIVLYTTAGDVRLSGSTASTTHLIVKNSGNVGINNTNPGARLHVESSTLQFRLSGNSNDFYVYAWGGGVNVYSTEHMYFGRDAGTDNKFYFQSRTASSTSLFVNTATERVGIFTTTPQERLDVRGNILLKGDAADGGVLTITRRYSTGPQTINFNNNHPTTNLDWTGARITSADAGNYNGYLDFAVSLGSNANEAAGTSAVASVMRLTHNRRVGVGGNTSPDTVLTVQGTGSASGHTTTDMNNIVHLTRNSHSYILFSSPDNFDQGLHFANTTDNGIVGRIAYFHRPGGDSLNFSVNQAVRMTLDASGGLTITGTLTEQSAARYKENIAPVTAALDKVDQLKPVSYNKKGSTTKEIGLIAEEVFDVYPEFVLCDDNGEPVGIHYSRLTAVLIESVKELKKEINELKNRN